jgi:predicted ATPase
MAMLRRVILDGFKSIKGMELELRPLNVLIGANGAGKSNLVSFFKMLNEMMGGRLQQYIGASGRAQSLLHYGPKVTPQLEAGLEFEVENGVDTYSMRLFHAAGDKLVFAEETLNFLQTGYTRPQSISLGAGHEETRLVQAADNGDPTAKVFRHLLNHCRVYHFHDTSSTARVRQYCYVGDNRWLMSDAGNLAALLLRLRQENGGIAYQRIVATIRLIAPFFRDFVMEPSGPNKRDVNLDWLSDSDGHDLGTGTGGGEQVFGPHQLSDGTLRAMCLVTLLMQPEDELPDLIIVDEPELGLHPYALNLIASLFQKVSHRVQVLISTQSSAFVDSFDPEDVIVVNREGSESRFTRPDADKLKGWLEDYSLGEVWEKNVIGGGPH